MPAVPSRFHTSALSFALALGVLASGTLAGCAPGHRLADVALEGESVAVLAAVPPHPRVQAGHPAEQADRRGDLRKRRAARRAQARLDSTVQQLDVADRIARQVLARSARALGFTPSSSLERARYVVDLKVDDYALVADSFRGTTFFVLGARIELRDRTTGRVLWRDRIEERETLRSSRVRLPARLGNRVTAEHLAELTPRELQAALNALADHAAARITASLERDYAGSRRAWARRAE